MLDADEVIRRWMEKRDKIFTDGKKPQNYQSPEFWEMLEKYTKKVKDNKK